VRAYNVGSRLSVLVILPVEVRIHPSQPHPDAWDLKKKPLLAFTLNIWRSRETRNSSVSIVTGYGLDGRGSVSGRDKRFFSSQRVDRLWGPPIYWVPGPFPQGVKLTSPPSSAEVRNGGAVSPLPHKSSWPVAWLFKHWDNFTFFLP
jgi:hypothetical protein